MDFHGDGSFADLGFGEPFVFLLRLISFYYVYFRFIAARTVHQLLGRRQSEKTRRACCWDSRNPGVPRLHALL